MHNEHIALPNSEPLKGLPPVTPPSGKHIVQLFVVPAIIVAIALAIILGFKWLVGGPRTPDQFLRDLGDANVEVRWRAASDLAQVLPRDPQLAANPQFALDLADSLRHALRDSEEGERAWGDRSRGRSDLGVPEQSLQYQREYILFLVNCLGDCTLPVGVPLLNDLAVKEDGADAETVGLRRRVSVMALVKQGENLKNFSRQFDRLPAEQRETIRAGLEREADSGAVPRSEYARTALNYLNGLPSRSTLGVDKVLARCGDADDPLLRKFTALALNFWDGTTQENAVMEAALLKLSHDNGHGAKPEEVRVRGLETCYKATEILARRGYDKVVGRFPVLEDMLDEGRQEENFRAKLPGGRDVPDEPLVVSTVKGALRALADLHAKKPDLDLSRFDGAIKQLQEHSSHSELRVEAKNTWGVLRSH